MGYINLLLSDSREISIKQSQLCIINGQGELRKYPLEDINAVLIENNMLKLTIYTLSQFMENGIVFYCCDDKHLPQGVMFPLCSQTKSLSVPRLFQEAPKPLIKRLWQAIVVQKILNQAAVLKFSGKEYGDLQELAKNVSSGDMQNVEAQAAVIYFKRLFGDNFGRKKENIINSMLNYGYAIVRGAVARTLAVHGYQQSFGLKHKSVLNSFNLSDDIIEPFRPFVDLYAVKAQVNEDDEGLSREVKRDLLALLDKEVVSGEEKHALNYAVERTVSSLTRSLESGEASLILPEIVKDAKTHRYE